MKATSIVLSAVLIGLTSVPTQAQTSRKIANWDVTEWQALEHSNVTASVRTAGIQGEGTPATFTASCIKREVNSSPQTAVTVDWDGPLDVDGEGEGWFEYSISRGSYIRVSGPVSGESGGTVQVTDEPQPILRDIAAGAEGPLTLSTSIIRTHATAVFHTAGALQALTLIADACGWSLSG